MLSKKWCLFASVPVFTLIPQLAMAQQFPEEEHHHTVSEEALVSSIESYAATAQQTAAIIQQFLILPAIKTRTEMDEAAARQALQLPQSFGAALRYQNIDPKYAEDGDLYGGSLAMMWDTEALTYGVMVPYDNLDFNNLDANRIGVVGFGQFRQEIQQSLGMTYTGYLNYNNTNVSVGSKDDDINNYGGGLAAALTMDRESYVLGASLAYQYNTDDSNVRDDEQHLLKTGLKTGLRFGEMTALSLYGIWTLDFTDYDIDPEDDDYFEVGAELTASLSDTWGLTFGAKDLIGLDYINVQEVYLGSIWKF